MTFEAELRKRLLESFTVLRKFHVNITNSEWANHVDKIVSIVLSGGKTKKTGGSIFSVIKKAWRGSVDNLKVVSKVSNLYGTKLTDYFNSISGGGGGDDEKPGWSVWAKTAIVVTVILVIAATVLYVMSTGDVAPIPLNDWGPWIPPPPPPGDLLPINEVEAIIANLPNDFGPSLWGPAGAGYGRCSLTSKVIHKARGRGF